MPSGPCLPNSVKNLLEFGADGPLRQRTYQQNSKWLPRRAELPRIRTVPSGFRRQETDPQERGTDLLQDLEALAPDLDTALGGDTRHIATWSHERGGQTRADRIQYRGDYGYRPSFRFHRLSQQRGGRDHQIRMAAHNSTGERRMTGRIAFARVASFAIITVRVPIVTITSTPRETRSRAISGRWSPIGIAEVARPLSWPTNGNGQSARLPILLSSF